MLYLRLEIETDRLKYKPGDVVRIHGMVRGNSVPTQDIIVSITVRTLDPKVPHQARETSAGCYGSIVRTNGHGSFEDSYRLPNKTFRSYEVIGVASSQLGRLASASCRFQVQSNLSIVRKLLAETERRRIVEPPRPVDLFAYVFCPSCRELVALPQRPTSFPLPALNLAGRMCPNCRRNLPENWACLLAAIHKETSELLATRPGAKPVEPIEDIEAYIEPYRHPPVVAAVVLDDIWQFILLSALSGVVGGLAYDALKKATRIIIAKTKDDIKEAITRSINGHEKFLLRELLKSLNRFNQREIEQMLRVTFEFAGARLELVRTKKIKLFGDAKQH